MCRGRSIFRAALLAAVLLTFLLPVTAWAEEGPQFQFVLSVDGETEEQVQSGDTVTAALHLERTDSDGGFAMYAMQDEVVYDPAFLQLLPENIMTADGVRTADVAAADGCRACYFSFVAFDGAANWEADTVVALFQFKVVGEDGASTLRSRNFLVSREDGRERYAASSADAAVVVSVGAEDFAGDPRRAIAFQRELEAKAYAAGRRGGAYAAPAENVQSFLEGKGQLNIGRVEPTYDRGVVDADLGALLPGELADTLRAGLRAYERKIAGYTAPEAILTGLETRTSSPVRLKREETLESAQLAGLYPCGEGAGYAGGIMSAAVDGLRVARAIIGRYAAAEG